MRARLAMRVLAGWLALAAAAGAWGCAPEADGPAPVAWDRVACAECRMLVGDPRFAAQLRTGSGERRYFDDPGCLLLHLADADPEVDGAWLHHAHEDRWLALEEAGFVSMAPSPMGHGLGAVERDQPGTLDAEQALGRIRATAQGGGGAR